MRCPCPIGVYPRGRGGNDGSAWGISTILGLSPRARGKLRFGALRRGDQGSIPAGAGETSPGQGGFRRQAVYPRGRGGNLGGVLLPDGRVGLSPRARGKRGALVIATGDQRSIPAGAGETHPWIAPAPMVEVYPRGRGGNALILANDNSGTGLSPRARGKRQLGRDTDGIAGSIPAGAGETLGRRRRIHPLGVYPRGRGGNSCSICPWSIASGLSPRARGKPT